MTQEQATRSARRGHTPMPTKGDARRARGGSAPQASRPASPLRSPSTVPAGPRRCVPFVLAVHPRRVASALHRGGAVLVLTLAALAAPLAAAQAQTVLWEQTMTVGGTHAGRVGWNDSGNHPGAALSDADETFEYDGHTYDLAEITSTGFELILTFNAAGAGDLATKATRDKLTFHVGTSTYNLGAAENFVAGTQIGWGRVLTWSAGDMLALKITTTDPGAPGLTAMAGVAAVTLNWTAPTSTGGLAITGYEYRQRTGDAYAADAWTTIANSASLTSYEVTGLTPGTAYTSQLRARNASGAGVYSAEATATPTADTTPPALESATVAVDGNSIDLLFDEPFDDGSFAGLVIRCLQRHRRRQLRHSRAVE